ncbi:FCD domain-containing protein [Heliorestis acidaminivorans]|uniref:FCD domain-containing protein n=1 Tax=Heliorestis acidaminivorans TaxID=553427 RepID=A0A6I0F0W9_9FIRM|nr:FCD domain-containing protein [Heliorestis acidaminivorans]KAB2954616.1 FCD domain-containing protein [Heliorestis acidaminivorans]
MTTKEEQEQAVLAIIHRSDEPIGSGSIRDKVADRGIQISEATVGRLLKEFDSNGYTEKRGYQGRILTEKGYLRLCELKHRRERECLTLELANSLCLETRKNMIDLLVARRAIEGEISALAAQNITAEELKDIEKILEHQILHYERGEYAVEQDLDFHRILAKAARNQVLEKAISLIRQEGRHSTSLEFIRRQVRSGLIEDHKKIVLALREGNSVKARQAMNEHIENLIKDIECYWLQKDSDSN